MPSPRSAAGRSWTSTITAGATCWSRTETGVPTLRLHFKIDSPEVPRVAYLDFLTKLVAAFAGRPPRPRLGPQRAKRPARRRRAVEGHHAGVDRRHARGRRTALDLRPRLLLQQAHGLDGPNPTLHLLVAPLDRLIPSAHGYNDNNTWGFAGVRDRGPSTATGSRRCRTSWAGASSTASTATSVSAACRATARRHRPKWRPLLDAMLQECLARNRIVTLWAAAGRGPTPYLP